MHRMLASRIPEELNLRTFEIGVTSFRLDPERFRTIAVYNDSLTLIVSPQHPLARVPRVSIKDLGKENFIAHNVASPLRQEGDRDLSTLPDALEYGDRSADDRGDQAVCGDGKWSGPGSPLDGCP